MPPIINPFVTVLALIEAFPLAWTKLYNLLFCSLGWLMWPQSREWLVLES